MILAGQNVPKDCSQHNQAGTNYMGRLQLKFKIFQYRKRVLLFLCFARLITDSEAEL